MSKIAIWTMDPDTCSTFREAAEQVEATGEILDFDSKGAGPEDLAKAIVAAAPDVIVMDDRIDDAFSVKAFQQARGVRPFLKAIFIISETSDLGHLLLAMNEGVTTLMEQPVALAKAALYLNRALARIQEETIRERELERCRRVADEEKACSLEQAEEISKMRRDLARSRRLVHKILTGELAVRSKKVLLVSDSPRQVDLFRRYLEEVHLNIISAGDGGSALDLARREKPALVVSDLELPDMNGLQLCLAVKNDRLVGPNHFIICTANADKAEEIMKPENKVDDCLIKPGRPEEFEAFTVSIVQGLVL